MRNMVVVPTLKQLRLNRKRNFCCFFLRNSQCLSLDLRARCIVKCKCYCARIAFHRNRFSKIELQSDRYRQVCNVYVDRLCVLWHIYRYCTVVVAVVVIVVAKRLFDRLSLLSGKMHLSIKL